MATVTTPARRTIAAALLTACCVQLFLVQSVTGTARRTTFFEDSSCTTEAFREYVYSARAVDTNGTVSEAPFNVCYARGSTGAITTCNAADGSTTVETYLDTECSQHLYSTSTAPECINLFDEGEPSPPGGTGSSTADCSETSPSEVVVPEVFNLVGSPYSDNQCTTRTGGEHVVPGSAFGVGSGECDSSFLSRGRLNALSKCMPDGSIFSQVFDGTDDTCTGEMLLESVVFSATSGGGGVCSLGHFEDRYEYYRLTSCTTETATDRTSTPPTPAPTVGTEDDDHSYNYGADPPIDYNGDGDDEDLHSTTDDDYDSGDSKDGSRDTDDDHETSSSSGGDDAESGGHPSPSPSDDDYDEPHPSPSPRHPHDSRDSKDSRDSRDSRDSKDSNDHGSSDSEDENGTGTAGGGDSSDGNDSSDDTLNDDGIFAVVFGCTMAVLICLFSAILAFAGRERDAKVGPKA